MSDLRASRETTFFHRELTLICQWSTRWALPWVLVTLALCVPAFMSARTLGLDTNLTRLLPAHSPAVLWSEELEPLVGDGGYFSVIVEGGPEETLRGAVDSMVERLRQVEGIATIDYRYPTEFVNEYKYTLVPAYRLEEMIGTIEEWEAQVNPFLDDFGDPDAETESNDELEKLMDQYRELPEYHRTADSTMFGMIVNISQGLSDMGATSALYTSMRDLADAIETESGVTISIGGSLRTRVEEFAVITADVQRTGLVAIIAIMATLAISFRSIKILPVVVYPLIVGLLWAFAFVPSMVGDLNTITSFLLMVLFGMGVDYSIHLTKRFRHELLYRSPEDALLETFTSTGRSVATSGGTTAFGLLILAISDFRGFYDFGLIGGVAIAVVTLAMLFVMPATLILGCRMGLIVASEPRIPSRHFAIPPRWAAAILAVLVLASGAASSQLLAFDYDFANFSANLEELDAIKAKQDEVYPIFFGPSAIYVAEDLTVLDKALALIEESRQRPDNVIRSISSIRDFAPSAAEGAHRKQYISDIQEMLSGRWVRRVEDPDRIRLIEDVLAFQVPERLSRTGDVPTVIRERMVARDGSGELVLGLHATGNGKDGRITMEFVRQLYDIEMPAGLRGPTGDKPVLAEILWLVTSEAPLIVVLTFLGIFVLVVIDRRDVNQAAWVLVPLVASLLLTFGAIIALGWKLNFFNIVVLPTLLGLGVDHGIHFYRRWRELGQDTAATQLELFEPITVATVTTIMGYAGMAFAHHPGLRSIGLLAVVGLSCTWITATVLLPGLLGWRERPVDDDEDMDPGAGDSNPALDLVE
jgi:predicted RND superfamily exporter protein